MNNLKELEKKYEELGKEIERLKKNQSIENDPIFLLSKEEYDRYKDRIPHINCLWWLRSPGCSPYYAAFVYNGGSVGDRGSSIIGSTFAVRPALRIARPEKYNIQVGTRTVRYGFPMTKCKSYCEEKERHYYTDYEKGYLDALHKPHDDFVYRTVSKCNGTKERDRCDCGGNPLKCSFYPEKRKQAIRETYNSKADQELLYWLRTNMTSVTRYVFNEKEDRSAEYRELAKEAVNNILLLINGEGKK